MKYMLDRIIDENWIRRAKMKKTKKIILTYVEELLY